MIIEECNTPESIQEAEDLLKLIKGVDTLPDNCMTSFEETLLYGVAIAKVIL